MPVKLNKINNDTCVYFHINPLKNEVFYVGIGSLKRAYSKKYRSLFWKKTVNKYGFIVDVIETNLIWNDACEKEKFYIKRIGRRDLNLGPLVNMTNGGDGAKGVIMSEETKRKISESGKIAAANLPLEVKTRISKNRNNSIRNKGKKHSDKTKTKMSEAAKGRKVLEETKQKISKTLTGLPSNHKGNKHSDETKRKISESLKLSKLKRKELQ